MRQSTAQATESARDTGLQRVFAIREHPAIRARMQSAVKRMNVLGVGVSIEDIDKATEAILDVAERDERGYVAFLAVHGIMEAYRDAALRRIFNRALLCNPDGMPLAWIGRLQGFRDIHRVYGPDLMLRVCERSQNRPFRHFLFGGKPGVAGKLQQGLRARFPGIQIAGNVHTTVPALRRSGLERLDGSGSRRASPFFLGRDQYSQTGEIHGGGIEERTSLQRPAWRGGGIRFSFGLCKAGAALDDAGGSRVVLSPYAGAAQTLAPIPDSESMVCVAVTPPAHRAATLSVGRLGNSLQRSVTRGGTCKQRLEVRSESLSREEGLVAFPILSAPIRPFIFPLQRLAERGA